MKNRKLWISLMAGLLAALMIFGIIASALPTYVSAAKSSAQIQQEINAMKEQLKNKFEEQIKAARADFSKADKSCRKCK